MLLAGMRRRAVLVGGDVFGVAAGRRRDHAVAGLEALHRAAHRLDLAGAFEPEPRADAADAAVLMAHGDAAGRRG